MSRADWRAPGAYEELRSLDAPGFAWEYLRRNPDFGRDRARLEMAAHRDALTEADAETFAQRWGVRFHGCYEHDRRARGPLDGKCAAKGDCPDGTAG